MGRATTTLDSRRRRRRRRARARFCARTGRRGIWLCGCQGGVVGAGGGCPSGWRARVGVAVAWRVTGRVPWLDTSVVIDLDEVAPHLLPREGAIARPDPRELAAGPHSPDNAAERARRQERLHQAEAILDPLPFNERGGRAYERAYAATQGSECKPRGARSACRCIPSGRSGRQAGRPTSVHSRRRGRQDFNPRRVGPRSDSKGHLLR